MFNSMFLFSLFVLFPLLLVQTAGLFWLAVKAAKPEKLTRVRVIVWVLVLSSVQVLWCSAALLAGPDLILTSLVLAAILAGCMYAIGGVWALWCGKPRAFRAATLSLVFVVLAITAELVALHTRFFMVSTPSAGGYQPIASPVETWVVSRSKGGQRWDLIGYAEPSNYTGVEVARLIGLPGEHVQIIDGQLVIDGKPIAPPVRRSNVPVYPDFPNVYGPSGPIDLVPETIDFDVRLADDEYFVLGHGVAHVNDSRYWISLNGGEGFALPKADVRGVVRMITWPTERFRIFR